MGVIASILVLLGSKLLTYAAIGFLAMMAPLIAEVASALVVAVLVIIVVHSLDEDDEKKEGNEPPSSK